MRSPSSVSTDLPVDGCGYARSAQMTTIPMENGSDADGPPSASSVWTIRYAVSALVSVVVAAVLIGLPFRGHRNLAMGLGGLILDMVMLLTLVPLSRRQRLRARDLGLRGTAPAGAVGRVLLAVLAVAVTNAFWLQGVLGKSLVYQGLTIHAGTVEEVVIGIQLAVSAPIIEEIFFRGLLYRAFRNHMNILPAALIAGFLFGAVHGLAYPLNTLPPRMVFGVIACLLYESTGSLYPSMALHGLIDGAALEEAIGHHRPVGIALAVYVILALVLLCYAGVRRVNTGKTRTPSASEVVPRSSG